MTVRSFKSALLSPNLAGSLWMIAAMAAFALEDAFVKQAAKDLPVSQVLILFGLGGALAFWGLARLKRETVFHADVLSPVMKIRFVFELVGRLFYILALALTPLSSTTAILQATPIFVVLGAALFFGESVGWRRWSAIVIGLVGVLIVLRPAGDSFSLLSLLAVIGMLGFSGRDLASRAAPATLSTNVLGFYGFITIIIAGILFYFWEQPIVIVPTQSHLQALAAAVALGVVAYTSLMKAMRTGEVAAVTPFRYSRLLFGMLLGVVWFGETVDIQMMIGCGVIVASGLFILWRSNRVRS
ncbi:DMT family transporter [uncultured Roseibium sp.]|uniref:DMT family transporter n=1 Tax=uncultured Roseibium sp. TaxID=1936171 RepID=UPI00262679AB|nr:DMT family transporter [uncultured Roseibium sp.]